VSARRRAQEAGRRARAAQRERERRAEAVRQRGTRRLTEADEEDAVWAEHQAYERARRTAPPAVRERGRAVRPTIDIRAVIAAVEADFARWRGGDFS
jgi:hypothetical protein